MSDSYNWAGNKMYDSSSKDKKSQSNSRERTTSEVIIPANPPELSSIMYQDGPPPITDINYIPGYLKSIIGKNVRAEFVVGTNQYLDKTGTLRVVGVNYFVLEDYISHDLVMCDLYSVKFVTVI